MKIGTIRRLSRSVRGAWRRRVLCEHGYAVLADTWNGLLALDPGDFTISQRLLRKGEYGASEAQFLATLLQPNATVIIVGAHIGTLLIPLVRDAVPARVIAYEPSPRNVSLLRVNLLLNGMSEQVEVWEMAIGAAFGTLRFTENPINTGNSRIDIDHGEKVIAVAPLDECLPLTSTNTPIDLMVIDVEGFEVEAMRGARATLARTKYLFIEFAPEQLEEQGATVDEFAALVGAHFTCGYSFGRHGAAPISHDVAGFIRAYPRRRGLLLNLLLMRETRDAQRGELP